MSALSGSHVSKALLSLLLVAGTVCTRPALLGQTQEPPKYTAEEYKAYQEISNEADVAKKTGLITRFLKDRPDSTLRQHVIAGYQAVMNELQNGQKWAELVSTGEAFLSVAPDDIFTFSVLATGYQKTGNLKQFVVVGEKVYEKNPGGNLAYYLAKAHKDLKNDAKFLEWGEKAVEFFPDNHEILVDLTKKLAESKRNAAKSAKYGRQCIKVLQSATKPDRASEKDWKDYVGNSLASCYAIVGNVAYDGRDYQGAIVNLENSLKYYGRNEIAYYYLGHSYWQQGKVDIAMKNFAKAYLLKGGTARAAKQYLDNLYKSTHQNSLVGLERVIAKAQQELP